MIEVRAMHHSVHHAPPIHNTLRPLQLLGWLVAGALVLVHWWSLNRYAVDFPFQDDFTQFVAVPFDIANLSTLREKITYLFSSSGDHRVVTLRLAALIQSQFLGGLDFKMLVYFGNLLCATTGLLVLSRAEPSRRALLAPLFVALLFSPSNYIAQFWASAALQHLSLIAYGFGALYCLYRTGVVWELGGLLLGMCAVMTGANGLVVLPVGAALLYVRNRRRTSALWVLLTVVIWSLYFVGHQAPVGRPSSYEILKDPLRLLASYFATLGSMGGHFDFAVILGLVLVAVWIWLVLGHRMIPDFSLPGAWMAFILASAGTVAVGRGLFGDEAVVNSRYHVYSELAALITTVAVLYRVSYRNGNRLISILLALAGIWSWNNWETYLPHVADLATRQRNALDHYTVTGHGDYGEWPPQAVADLLLSRVHSVGVYAAGKDADAPGRLTESAKALQSAGRPALWSAPPFVYANAISVRGQTWLSMRDVTLWLQGDAHRYSGPMRTQRVFNEIFGKGRLVFW
ncbi:MAG: hypothetical protein ACRD9W_07250, partial [Terriglobia bacterium]